MYQLLRGQGKFGFYYTNLYLPEEHLTICFVEEEVIYNNQWRFFISLN